MKKIILLMLSSLLLFVTSCKGKIQKDDNSIKFKEDIKKIINLINDDNSIKGPSSFILSGEYISGFDANNELKYFTLESNNIDYGIIYLNEDNKMYASFENSEFCAIKDFDSEDFDIYNIEDKKSCHKFYSSGDETILIITPINIETNEIYQPGTVSNNYIKMFLYENIIDDKAVEYIWYRNGEKIDNNNNNTYTIEKDYENAIYYVEIHSLDGQIIKSNEINIKIDKAD